MKEHGSLFPVRHDDEGQKLAKELRKLGTEAEFVRTDVRHEEGVKDLVGSDHGRGIYRSTRQSS